MHLTPQLPVPEAPRDEAAGPPIASEAGAPEQAPTEAAAESAEPSARE